MMSAIDTTVPVVLYEKVKAALVDRLLSPEFADDASIGSERDLIKTFGVSRITIRRALSELEKDGLVYRVPGKGTFRQSDRAKTPSTSNNLMTVFMDEGIYRDEFCTEAYAGIVNEASRLGYHIMSGRAVDDHRSREMGRRMLAEYPSSACFLVVRNPADFIKEAGLDPERTVVIENQIEVGGKPVMSVVCDNSQGVSLAMEHLIGLGHRRIAFLADRKPWVSPLAAYQRLSAWRSAVQVVQGDNVDSWVLRWNVETETNGDVVLRDIKRLRPTAIVCANDWLATNLLTLLTDNGIRVPASISVVGFDDIPLARHLGLTTVTVPMRHMGEIAVRRAVNRIMSTDFGPACTVQPLTFTIRKSTATPLDTP